MKILVTAILVLSVSGFASGQDKGGETEENRACIECHSLRLVHSQRLSREAWGKEIDKMVGWGAPVRERQTLLDYLAREFNSDKAANPVTMTEDTSSATKKK
jgi:hypothetical protein